MQFYYTGLKRADVRHLKSDGHLPDIWEIWHILQTYACHLAMDFILSDLVDIYWISDGHLVDICERSGSFIFFCNQNLHNLTCTYTFAICVVLDPYPAGPIPILTL